MEFESPQPGGASPSASDQLGGGARGTAEPISDPVGTALIEATLVRTVGRALNMPQRSPTVTPPSCEPRGCASAEDASLHGSYAHPREG